MGGDASLWRGLYTPSMKQDIEAVLRRSFGTDVGYYPTMYSLFLRKEYPELYEEVKQHAQG